MTDDRIFESFVGEAAERSAIRRALWYRQRGVPVCVVASRVGSLDGRPKFSVEDVGARCMPLLVGERVVWPPQERLEAVAGPGLGQSSNPKPACAPRAVGHVCRACSGSGWSPLVRLDSLGEQGERCRICGGVGRVWEGDA